MTLPTKILVAVCGLLLAAVLAGSLAGRTPPQLPLDQGAVTADTKAGAKVEIQMNAR